jgi:hypothetical protein
MTDMIFVRLRHFSLLSRRSISRQSSSPSTADPCGRFTGMD